MVSTSKFVYSAPTTRRANSARTSALPITLPIPRLTCASPVSLSVAAVTARDLISVSTVEIIRFTLYVLQKTIVYVLISTDNRLRQSYKYIFTR